MKTQLRLSILLLLCGLCVPAISCIQEPAKTTVKVQPLASNTGAQTTPESTDGEGTDNTQTNTTPGDPSDQPSDPLVTAKALFGPHDWPQWGGSSMRNNTPEAANIPAQWDIGEFDDDGNWIAGSGQNIKWVSKLGSQSYGNPVIANGQVYVGTNNGAGWIKRYPARDVDLGCVICFSEKDGKFLWQHSNEKLASGRVNDWELQGVCCAPMVEGERLWYVSSRGEVVCLDTQGFHDGENDGPFKEEPNENKDEADVIWAFDMMKEIRLFQHNMCSCSVTGVGDLLFVNTSNGVDESHFNIPSPDAPSFLCMDKNTGKVLWSDKSPGLNILHGQWSSPTVAVLGGVTQVIFPAGDGWIYSFLAEKTDDGKAKLLWKFDANPKETRWVLGGRGKRNNVIGTATIYNDLVYVGVGQDPEHGEGDGHMWCIDPTKRGDVSPQIVVNDKDPETPIPHRRLQAAQSELGDVVRDNPNSAALWRYSKVDTDGNGKFGFEETMHRTCGTVAIKNDLLFVADFSGLVHCLDAKTGKPHWTHDMLAAAWGSALIVDGKVYFGDEDGDVTVFKLSKELDIIAEINMDNAVYSTAVVANGTLFIANRTHLFAIEAKEGTSE